MSEFLLRKGPDRQPWQIRDPRAFPSKHEKGRFDPAMGLPLRESDFET